MPPPSATLAPLEARNTKFGGQVGPYNCAAKRPICNMVPEMTSPEVKVCRSQSPSFDTIVLPQQLLSYWVQSIGVCHHCVPLVEKYRMIPKLTLQIQGQSLTLCQRSGQVKVGHVAYHSIRSDDKNILVPFSFVYHTWFKSYRQKTYSAIGL